MIKSKSFPCVQILWYIAADYPAMSLDKSTNTKSKSANLELPAGWIWSEGFQFDDLVISTTVQFVCFVVQVNCLLRAWSFVQLKVKLGSRYRSLSLLFSVELPLSPGYQWQQTGVTMAKGATIMLIVVMKNMAMKQYQHYHLTVTIAKNRK